MNRIDRTFVIILIIFTAVSVAHAIVVGKTVYGDGRYYFSWLHALAVDRWVDFTDEYHMFGATHLPTPRGAPGNKYTIGPAILWLPFYLNLYSVSGGTGFEFRYQLTTAVTSVFYVLTGLILLFRILTNFYSRSSSALAVLSVAFATNLFFYGAVDTVNSHGLSFFAVCLFLGYTSAGHAQPFVSGLLLGLVAIIRPQDTVAGLILAVRWRRPRHVAPVLAGFIAVVSIQAAAWYSLYQSFIPPYFLGGEGFRINPIAITGVLFSPDNGMLLWNPVLSAAFFGLVRLWRRRSTAVNAVYLLVFAIQLILISSWSTPSQGASYGSRMFVGMLPILGIGLAEFFTLISSYRLRLKHALYVVVLPLSVLNAVFILYFLAVS